MDGISRLFNAAMSEKPSRDAVTGVVLHSDTAPTGHFECSDPLVNQLQSNIKNAKVDQEASGDDVKTLSHVNAYPCCDLIEFYALSRHLWRGSGFDCSWSIPSGGLAYFIESHESASFGYPPSCIR